MFDKLNEFENNLIGIFLEIDFSWKAKLIQQIMYSSVKSEDCFSSYFIDFLVDRKCEPINTSNRVPIEVLIDHQDNDCSKIIYFRHQSIIFPNLQDATPSCLCLHIENGYLIELEAYSLAGTPLNSKTLFTGKKYYFLLEQ